jgi:RHS repeat-associated protein
VQKQFFRFICLFLLLFQFAVLANSSSSCDHLGTPKELYNAQGECVWQAQHSLWGKLSLVKSKSYNPTQAVIEQNAGSNDYKEDLDFQLPNHSCELRFAGQWFDSESGLHYNYNRYYDPNSGQYLSQDPIGLAGGMRTQAYVADPVHWVDPLGLAPCVGKDANGIPIPYKGQKIYRVYGGDSEAGGASWSPKNPGSVNDYRGAAGLPSGGASGYNNSGRFVIEGRLNDPSKVVLTRRALPLDGNNGGIPEYIIPRGLENGAVKIKRVSGVNPEF